jgi:hypothetical protein
VSKSSHNADPPEERPLKEASPEEI